MIKTLSPYYITIPFTNPTTSVVCDSYVFKLFIWDGSKIAIPSTPEYEKTIINASASNGNSKLEIAKLVNDFIDFNCVNPGATSLEDGNNQVWVKWAVYYNDQPEIPQNQNTELATKGYGWFLDGENPQLPTNKILLTGDEFKVNRNGFFVLPIIMTETEYPEPEIVITDVYIDSGIYYITFTYVGVYSEFTAEYISTPFGEIIGTTSPQVLSIAETAAAPVRLIGFDLNTGNTVYSNTFEI